MLVFEWTPDFQSKKESSFVLVWISFSNLRAHLYEKSALFVIAKIMGRLLMVDKAIANGTRPSMMRIYVEYNCPKPLVDQVWIVTRDRKTEDVTKGFMQKVEFARPSEYCTHAVMWDTAFRLDNACNVTMRKQKKKKKGHPGERSVGLALADDDKFFDKEQMREVNKHSVAQSMHCFDKVESSDENSPLLENKLGNCGDNKEFSSIPSHAGSSHATIKVHLTSMHRSKSGNVFLVTLNAQYYSDEAEGCEEKDRMQEYSISAGFPTHTFP
ncbi:Uncharacterized protein TCM_028132 [Theobroma cacao]|uniref:Uncharacterized protein n=1 Tax=Theobroma cacao TaxID=3641 RepID=A0A061GA54_THECC|nr:Uncharacterized protein TCM_028132 [Theobroma cacao]